MSGIKIVLGDITKSDCECIVNAANKSLLGGGGVDGAIHRAAGRELYNECKTLGGCETGEAKITKGYNLKARYIIHTVGPVYQGIETDTDFLRNCYINSLELAKAKGIRSISFPAISTGAYGFPKMKAAFIALNNVLGWMAENPVYNITVEFCCFGEEDYNIYLKAYGMITGDNQELVEDFAKFVAENDLELEGLTVMHLADEPFENIRSGQKTVEIRLYDEKRKKINVGDTIFFFRGQDNTEFIYAIVTALHHFDSFKALFSSHLFDKTGSGNMTVDEAVKSMYKYYSIEQEQKYGVLGIEIEKAE
ncbi:MAG: O-acetyl-ADP-ribose deacetylase [Clostridia bacterium]|nr:O-acetyl-ADP-ribose deacetylase [Clostridia bacterium]